MTDETNVDEVIATDTPETATDAEVKDLDPAKEEVTTDAEEVAAE